MLNFISSGVHNFVRRFGTLKIEIPLCPPHLWLTLPPFPGGIMLPSPSRPLPSSARPSGPSPASLPTRFPARDGGNGAAPQSAASNPVRKCACEGRRDGGRNERRRRRRQRPPSPKSVARFQERNAKLTKLQCNADYECHESPPASMFVNGFRTLRAR